MTPRPRFFVALLSLLALVLFAAAVPAGAHEGEGEFVVEARESQGSGFRYVVRLTWTNDGHAALDSTVTATAIAANGTPQTPVTLNPLDQDGRYAALVPSPAGGPYTVRFTAVTPEATAEVTQRPPPTTTTSQPDPPTTEPPTASSATVADRDEVAADDEQDEQDDRLSSPLFFVAAIAALALIAVPILRQRQRSRT